MLSTTTVDVQSIAQSSECPLLEDAEMFLSALSEELLIFCRQGLCASNAIAWDFSSLCVFQHLTLLSSPAASQPLPCSLRMMVA